MYIYQHVCASCKYMPYYMRYKYIAYIFDMNIYNLSLSHTHTHTHIHTHTHTHTYIGMYMNIYWYLQIFSILSVYIYIYICKLCVYILHPVWSYEAIRITFNNSDLVLEKIVKIYTILFRFLNKAWVKIFASINIFYRCHWSYKCILKTIIWKRSGKSK